MTGPGSALDRAIGRVVASGNCSGCGMCALLDSGLQMRPSDDGYNGPSRVGPDRAVADSVSRFDTACPGVRVATWLAETGQATRIVGARAAQDNPRRAVSVQITTREAATASAGSRYAPASNCEIAGSLDEGAFIGGARSARTEWARTRMSRPPICGGPTNKATRSAPRGPV